MKIMSTQYNSRSQRANVKNETSFGALVFNNNNIQKYEALLLKGEMEKASFTFENRISELAKRGVDILFSTGKQSIKRFSLVVAGTEKPFVTEGERVELKFFKKKPAAKAMENFIGYAERKISK